MVLGGLELELVTGNSMRDLISAITFNLEWICSNMIEIMNKIELNKMMSQAQPSASRGVNGNGPSQGSRYLNVRDRQKKTERNDEIKLTVTCS